MRTGSRLTANDLQIITGIAVFRDLDRESVAQVIAPATVVTLTTHETLVRQDEPATAFFIVVDGWIKLYRISRAGDETVIQIVTKGDSFAEAVAFAGARYLATSEAVSPARVVRIPADHILRCISRSPDIALAMIASASVQVHHIIQLVEQLKAQSGLQRVAEFLVSLAPVDDGAYIVTLPYDKVLIAARLGLKPESLSRAFAKLRSVGVTVDAENVAVRDVTRLRQIAGNQRATVRQSFVFPIRSDRDYEQRGDKATQAVVAGSRQAGFAGDAGHQAGRFGPNPLARNDGSN